MPTFLSATAPYHTAEYYGILGVPTPIECYYTALNDLQILGNRNCGRTMPIEVFKEQELQGRPFDIRVILKLRSFGREWQK